MTSINALRLNQHSGLLVCDEARFWNNEWVVILTPDKIRPLVAPDITRETGVILYIGSTGTSSYGDEIMESIRQHVSKTYHEAREKGEPIPEEILTVEGIVRNAFTVVKDLHHTHIDDFLRGCYGFVGQDLVQGYKLKAGRKYELAEDKIIKKAVKHMTFADYPPELSGLLNNAQVFAGYDPTDGFRIFIMEERNTVLEEVSDIFLAEGSGTITCDLVLSGFASSRSVVSRRKGINRVEALISMLEGVEEAHQLAAGVCGYPKIIYIDGQQTDLNRKIIEISDCRSRLATEITMASAHGFITPDAAYTLIDGLIFHEVPFQTIDQQFMALDQQKQLFRFLRGYRHKHQVAASPSKKGQQS
ncbi:hypothetical protein ACFL27_18340 [candidate division CSSED10-310 bacterium]|uniref:Uncharacterized protein n=1 Tax=candidate division CSSED10-310 bacterium TaxID=2855610 RepID=A0ABV6Z131_UNCC1